MHTKHFLTILLSWYFISVYSQPNLKLGIETANSVFFSLVENEETVKGSPLLRYSVGLTLRQQLKKGTNKFNYFRTARHNGVFLDYGVNFAFGGYQYKIGNLETYNDQLWYEFPILLVLRYRDIFWMNRKWKRKGIGSYVRMGVKPSYLPQQTIVNSTGISNESLQGVSTFGGWNLAYSLGSGFDQTLKNGDLMSFGWQVNFNLKQSVNTNLTYTTNNNTQDFDFNIRSFYFALNVQYLFDSKRFGKGVLPPVIYNPRFN